MKVVIKTPRLFLRSLTLNDAAFLLELMNSPGWLQYIGDRGVRTLDDARRYLTNRIIKSYEDHGFGLYLMCRKGAETPIGMCGLIRRPGLNDVDIGFAVLPEFTSLGYASEAAAGVMDYAQNELKLSRLVAITLPTNAASIRLLKKIGMQFERMVQLPDDEEELMLFGWERAGHGNG